MVKQDLILSMSEPTNRTIYAKKGDSGRLYDIFIADAEKENGTLRILQPDGSEVTAPAIIQAGGDAYKGDLVTFDALEEVPLTKAEVSLESTQDLHGYANPWVGGAGKNKVPKGTDRTNNDITYTVQDDGRIKVTGTATATSFWGVQFTIPSGSYVLNGCPSGGGNSTYLIDVRTAVGGSGISGISGDSGNGSAFTLSAPLTAYLNIRIASGYTAPSGGLIFSPMIRLATETDATFAPYSNICPIYPSNGKNLLPNVKGQNGANYVTLGQTNPHTTSRDIYLTKGEYTLSTTSSKSGYSLFYCDNNGSSTRITSGGKVGTFTLSADGYYAFYIYYSSGITTDDIETFQLEQGSTATPYVPYQGINVYHSGEDTTDYTTYPLSLGQNVYGGKVDVVSGKLTIDKYFTQISGGATKYTNDSGYYWYTTLSGISAPSIKGLNEGLMSNKFVAWANTTADTKDGVMTIYANGIVRWKEQGSMSQNDYNTWLGTNPIEICYDLAEPTEVDLTPTQITTLLGENNVWSSGEVEVAFEYDGLFAQLPEEATEQVGKCIGDVAFTGASSMPFILHILDDVQEETP